MTTSLDREEIKTLLSEGWKPRVKRVKSYEYISLRRGSGEKEVSLGRKTDELWSFIEANMPKSEVEELKTQVQTLEERMADLKKELEKMKAAPRVDESSKLLERLKADVAKNQGVINYLEISAAKIGVLVKQKDYCKHLGDDGYCTYWRWPERQEGRDQKKREKDGQWFDNVKDNPIICVACPRFSKLNENAYEDLERLKVDVAKNQVVIGYLKTTATRRVKEKRQCKRLGEDGYCTLWHWSERQEGRDQKRREDGRWYDNVRDNPVICVACPSYEKVQ